MTSDTVHPPHDDRDPYAADVDDPILIEINRILDSRPVDPDVDDTCFGRPWFAARSPDVDGGE